MALGLLPGLFSFAALRLYDLETVLEDSQEYATVATGCTYGILLLIVLNTLAGDSDLALRWLFTSWVLSVLAVCAGRFAMRRVVRAMRRRGHLMALALVVGADEQGRTIARQLRSEADSGLRVLGFVDDFLPRGTPVQDGLTVLGHPGVLPTLVRDYRLEAVLPDGGTHLLTAVTDNRARHRRHRWDEPVLACAVRLVVTATNGAPCAHVVSLRAWRA